MAVLVPPAVSEAILLPRQPLLVDSGCPALVLQLPVPLQSSLSLLTPVDKVWPQYPQRLLQREAREVWCLLPTALGRLEMNKLESCSFYIVCVLCCNNYAYL